jgi:site-specific DNA-cytosine methylase
LKLLELFCGTKSITKIFDKHGHDTYTIDYNPELEPDLCIDIMSLTSDMIIEKFGRPDVIWASPDCTSYSIAAISHHRYKEEDGNLAPKSDYAKFCDKVNTHVMKLIKELNPKYYFIENPRGGMRKMNFIKDKPRYTVWYCQYGDIRAKPTDIWTNYPNPQFKPVCHNGNKNCHHESAPRGSKTGTQGLKGSRERGVIPEQLCEHICKICEETL